MIWTRCDDGDGIEASLSDKRSRLQWRTRATRASQCIGRGKFDIFLSH